MADCPTCGLPVTEGAKFCAACGGKLPVIIKQKTCKMCGNTMGENDTFCTVCGTPAAKEKTEEAETPKEDLANPTMDEVQIPVITDDIPALQEKPLKDANTPTMDSIYMPGQEPASRPAAAAVAAPTPEEVAMASQKVSIAKTPTVGSTPTVNDTYAQQNTAQAQNTVITPEGVIPANQANSIPNYGNGAYNQNTNVTPGKTGSSAIVPIILIILIIAVILVDVFFLFKKQIFGDDAKESCAIVTEIGSESGDVSVGEILADFDL